MEPEGSLPHSQVSATCPYPEPYCSSSFPNPTFWRSILILFSNLRLGLPSGLSLPQSPHQNPACTNLLPIRAIFPAHLILLDVITLTIFVGDTGYKAPHYVAFCTPLSDKKPRRVHMTKTWWLCIFTVTGKTDCVGNMHTFIAWYIQLPLGRNP